MRIKTLQQIMAIMLFLALTVSLKAQSKRALQLQKDYLEAAIGTFNGNKYQLLKWENKDTLKYHIEGDIRYLSDKKYAHFINEIAELINIPINETEHIGEADIKLFMGDLYTFFEKYPIGSSTNLLSPSMDHYHSRRFNSDKQLKEINYCIDSDKINDVKRGRYLLKRSFLKSLGIMGDSTDETSIFAKNTRDYAVNLSKNDKRIIKLHYAKELQAGMTEQEVITALSSLDLATLAKEKIK